MKAFLLFYKVYQNFNMIVLISALNYTTLLIFMFRSVSSNKIYEHVAWGHFLLL